MSDTTAAEYSIFAPWPFGLGVSHALWVERKLYKFARDVRLQDAALGPRRSRVAWSKRKHKRKRARRRA